MMIEHLDIGEVASRTGLTLRALRFYEGKGLVRPLRTSGGRRIYAVGDLGKLHAINVLKQAGFALAEIGRLLSRRDIDIEQLVATQLTVLDGRAADLEKTRTLLRSLQKRFASAEPLDIVSMCELLSTGHIGMTRDDWRAIAERFFTAAERERWQARLPLLPAGFDTEEYGRRWAELGSRIAERLPLDPSCAAAQQLLDEWEALLAPFRAVASPDMMKGATRLYDATAEWGEGGARPFSNEVWQFIQAAAANRQDPACS
jgi:MerR family transcriptional regulator, thiopeptide resistance regulator